MSAIRFACLCLAMLLPSSQAPAQEPALAPHERPSTWLTSLVRELQPGASAWDRPPTSTASLAHRPAPALGGLALTGIASFYWRGQMTASGEPFDKTSMTAAHPTLPFNTRVKVTHLGNGRSVVVRINDRGPFKPGRIIDLSYAAAGLLGMHAQGLARVRLDIVR